MRTFAYRHTTAAGVAVIALITAGCSGAGTDASVPPQVGLVATSEVDAPPADVKLTGDRDVEVTLTGPIAAKYTSATDSQRQALGKPLTGDFNAGTRESGVVFQQFQGGVITAKGTSPGTPAFITWGRIREAWNVPRDLAGVPAVSGQNGSVGPLGTATSDETPQGDLLVETFEHGQVAYDTKTGQVEVTVNGKVVPSGL
jgi:hypothetical protein